MIVLYKCVDLFWKYYEIWEKLKLTGIKYVDVADNV